MSKKTNLTAREWELFSGMAGVASVAKSLNQATDNAIALIAGADSLTSLFEKAQEAKDYWMEAALEFADYGALDTEPRYHFSWLLGSEIEARWGEGVRWEVADRIW